MVLPLINTSEYEKMFHSILTVTELMRRLQSFITTHYIIFTLVLTLVLTGILLITMAFYIAPQKSQVLPQHSVLVTPVEAVAEFAIFEECFVPSVYSPLPYVEHIPTPSGIKINGIHYTAEQRKLMTMAYHIGSEYGFPETIQSLLLQETRAGMIGDRIGDTMLPFGRRSYGVMQMKVATARKVLRKNRTLVAEYFPTRKTYKRVRDEEIMILLIQDDEFNINMAALNFVIHRSQSKNWAHAIVGYNTGQRGANKLSSHKDHKYYTQIVKKLISEVRPFNQLLQLNTKNTK